MANDKDIKIGIGIDANTSGAEKAENALNKVTEAGLSSEEKLKAASAEHAASMEKATGWADELRDGLSELEKGIDDLAKSGEEANKEAEELDENVRNISRVQRAQAVADLARGVGQIGGKFREAANEVRAYDSAAADAFDQTAERIEGVTNAVSALAQGFAVGGPLGAGVAAAGVGVMALVNAFKESEVTAIKAAASQSKALKETADIAREAATAAKERAYELEREGIEKSILAQNKALSDGLEIIDKQIAAVKKKRQEEEEIFDSKDRLRLAEIEEQEAKKEITPQEASTQRAEVEQGAVERQRAARKAEAVQLAVKADAEAKAAEEARQIALRDLKEKERASNEAILAAEEALLVAQDTALREKLQESEKNLQQIKDKRLLGFLPVPGQIPAAKQAAEERNKASQEVQEKVTTEEVPGLSAAQAKINAEAALKAANDRRKELKDAGDRAVLKSNEAKRARADAADATSSATDTFNTVDSVAKNDDAARAAAKRASRTRDQAALGNKTDTNGSLGARGVNPEGFNQLEAKIARKGDAQGGKLNLAAFLEKVSMLVDAIPDSTSSSQDAEILRQVERRIEQKVEKLKQEIRLNRR